MDVLRDYALEKLAKRSEAVDLRNKHAAYYLDYTEKIAPNLEGEDQTIWLAMMRTDYSNITAALKWYFEQSQLELYTRLCIALCAYWRNQGYFNEGRYWLNKVPLDNLMIPTKLRAKAVRLIGVFATFQADYSAANLAFEQSLKLLLNLDEKKEVAIVINNLGALAHMQGELVKAQELYEAYVLMCKELDDKIGIARGTHNLGVIAMDNAQFERAEFYNAKSFHLIQELGDKSFYISWMHNSGLLAFYQGKYEHAARLCQECLDLAEKLGNKSLFAHTLVTLGMINLEQNKLEKARALFEETLHIRRAIGDKRGLVWSLEGMAAVAGNLKSAYKAARLFGAASHYREIGSLPLPPSYCTFYHRQIEQACAHIGEQHWLGAWQEGYEMTLEQAVSYALINSFCQSP